MDGVIAKAGKVGGRPSLVGDEAATEIARLYFDLQWTAREIQERKYPALALQTIRSIASRTRKKQNPPPLEREVGETGNAQGLGATGGHDTAPSEAVGNGTQPQGG